SRALLRAVACPVPPDERHLATNHHARRSGPLAHASWLGEAVVSPTALPAHPSTIELPSVVICRTITLDSSPVFLRTTPCSPPIGRHAISESIVATGGG